MTTEPLIPQSAAVATVRARPRIADRRLAPAPCAHPTAGRRRALLDELRQSRERRVRSVRDLVALGRSSGTRAHVVERCGGRPCGDVQRVARGGQISVGARDFAFSLLDGLLLDGHHARGW